MSDNGNDNGNEKEVSTVKVPSQNPDYPASRTAGLMPPWRKDQSGNPAGMIPGTKTKRGFRAKLIKEMAFPGNEGIIRKLEQAGIELEDKSAADIIAKVVSLNAQKGDYRAIKVVQEETELPHAKDVNLNADFNVTIPGPFADAF